MNENPSSVAAQARQRLEAIGAKHSRIKVRIKPRAFNFAPGNFLLRERGEREHRAAVTAVARQITGQHRSGPEFFGLLKGGA